MATLNEAAGIPRTMPVPGVDIQLALDDLISNEEGMRFQGLAVVLAKKTLARFDCMRAQEG